MAETDLPNEDAVLRRMLATPPEKHKPLGRAVTARPPRKRNEVKDAHDR